MTSRTGFIYIIFLITVFFLTLEVRTAGACSFGCTLCRVESCRWTGTYCANDDIGPWNVDDCGADCTTLVFGVEADCGRYDNSTACTYGEATDDDRGCFGDINEDDEGDCEDYAAPPRCGNYECGPGRYCTQKRSGTNPLDCVCRCESSNVDLKAEINGVETDGPLPLTIGAQYRLSWDSENVVSCTLDGDAVDAVGFSEDTYTITGEMAHSIVCQRPGSCGTTSDMLYIGQDPAIPITAVAQGYKVSPDPVDGSLDWSGNPTISSQVVTVGGTTDCDVDGIAATYHSCWTTNPGATRTATVTVPGGWNVGYTLCYNDTNCHELSQSDKPIPGNSVIIDDSRARNENISLLTPTPMPRFVDLWWHFWPAVQDPPTGLAPDGEFCIPPTGTVDITWNEPASGAFYYSLRIDDKSSPEIVDTNGNGVCDEPLAAGDLCLDWLSTTYPDFPVQVGHEYDVWVHARSEYNVWSDIVVSIPRTNWAHFSVLGVPASPVLGVPSCGPAGNSINVVWSDVANEDGYRLTRYPVFAGGPMSFSPVVHEYLDESPPAPQNVDYEIVAHNSCGDSDPDIATVYCPQYESWFQASSGGSILAAGGPLEATIPATAPNPYLILNPAWYPWPVGWPAAMGDRDLAGWGGNLSVSNVSTAGVLMDISFNNTTSWLNWVSKAENTYYKMKERAQANSNSGQFHTISATSINQTALNDAINYAIANNHKIVLDDFNVGVDLQVAVINVTPSTGDVVFDDTGTIDVVSNNRGAIIFVDTTGTVRINKGIKPTDANTGFLAILTKGDLRFGNSVGADPPPPTDPDYQWKLAEEAVPADVSGVFYTQGVLYTGAGELVRDDIYRQLKIDGSIAGLAGVELERESAGPYPAELVKFNPRYAMVMMELGLRRKILYEQLVP